MSERFSSHMVATFLFTAGGDSVALIRKRRPQWQAGRLNGIGGKVTPADCAGRSGEPDGVQVGRMAAARELLEEAKVLLPPTALAHVCTLFVEGGPLVDFFSYRGPEAAGAKTLTDEAIEHHRVDQLPWADLVPNCRWLIPLALDHDLALPVCWSMRDPRIAAGTAHAQA